MNKIAQLGFFPLPEMERPSVTVVLSVLCTHMYDSFAKTRPDRIDVCDV